MCARYRYKILHIDLSDLSTVFVRWFHGIEKNCGQIDVLITVLPSQAGIGSCHFKMYKYNSYQRDKGKGNTIDWSNVVAIAIAWRHCNGMWC